MVVTQIQKLIKVDDAIKVIEDWLETDPRYYWRGGLNSDDPKRVIDMLKLQANFDGTIIYHRASDILRSVETTKMPASANKGMVFIKSEWRKLYLRD